MLAALNGDNTAVARYVSKLSLKQLEKRRDELEDQQNKLICLRRSYRRIKDKAIRKQIQNKGEEVKRSIKTYEDQQTLGQLRRAAREEDAESEVSLLIAWVQDQLNVQSPLMNDQIYTAAAMIVNMHGALRISDISICFREAVLGRYKRQYGKLDVQDILSWVDIYHTALKEQRISNSENKHIAGQSSNWDKRFSRSLRAVFHNSKHLNR